MSCGNCDTKLSDVVKGGKKLVDCTNCDWMVYCSGKCKKAHAKGHKKACRAEPERYPDETAPMIIGGDVDVDGKTKAIKLVCDPRVVNILCPKGTPTAVLPTLNNGHALSCHPDRMNELVRLSLGWLNHYAQKLVPVNNNKEIIFNWTCNSYTDFAQCLIDQDPKETLSICEFDETNPEHNKVKRFCREQQTIMVAVKIRHPDPDDFTFVDPKSGLTEIKWSFNRYIPFYQRQEINGPWCILDGI
tara:strand:+ start:1808 stop:2542 length:735 start_codon:yes stop_codon:yes gene_type:complete